MKQNVRVHNSQEKETEFSYGGLCSAQPTLQVMMGLGSEIYYQMVLFCWNERKLI